MIGFMHYRSSALVCRVRSYRHPSPITTFCRRSAGTKRHCNPIIPYARPFVVVIHRLATRITNPFVICRFPIVGITPSTVPHGKRYDFAHFTVSHGITLCHGKSTYIIYCGRFQRFHDINETGIVQHLLPFGHIIVCQSRFFVGGPTIALQLDVLLFHAIHGDTSQSSDGTTGNETRCHHPRHITRRIGRIIQQFCLSQLLDQQFYFFPCTLGRLVKPVSLVDGRLQPSAPLANPSASTFSDFWMASKKKA